MKLNLYRVNNKAKNGAYVFAESEEEALTIFHECGYVRRRENGKVSQTYDMEQFNDTDIRDVNVKGIGAIVLHNATMTGNQFAEMLAGTWVKPPVVKKWIVSYKQDIVKDGRIL